MTVPVRTSREGFDNMSIRWKGREANGIQVHTVDAEYFRIKKWDIAEGRPFSPQEAKHFEDRQAHGGSFPVLLAIV